MDIPPSLPLELDVSRTQAIIRQEVDAFEEAFARRDHLGVNDRRGLLVWWFSRYLPELFDDDLRHYVDLRYSRVRDKVGDDFVLQNYLLPLSVAMVMLHRDTSYVKTGIVATGGSALRFSAIMALATIADLLHIEDNALVDGTEFNLDIGQPPCDENIALLVLAKGDPDQKRWLFSRWMKMKLKGGGREIITALTNGYLVSNPLLYHYLEVTTYGLLRLSSRESNGIRSRAVHCAQPELPLMQVPNEPRLASTLCERLRDDPLLSSHIGIESTRKRLNPNPPPPVNTWHRFLSQVPSEIRPTFDSLGQDPPLSRVRMRQDVDLALSELQTLGVGETYDNVRGVIERCLSLLWSGSRSDLGVHMTVQAATRYLLKEGLSGSPATLVDGAQAELVIQAAAAAMNEPD